MKNFSQKLSEKYDHYKITNKYWKKNSKSLILYYLNKSMSNDYFRSKIWIKIIKFLWKKLKFIAKIYIYMWGIVYPLVEEMSASNSANIENTKRKKCKKRS